MPNLPPDTIVIVTAYNEAGRLPATLAALEEAFPRARLIVADDGSRDATGDAARRVGAEVVRSPIRVGKGGAATRAAERVAGTSLDGESPVIVFCDADITQSARELPALAEIVRNGSCDLAIAPFARRLGGGFGLALGFARWVTSTLSGVDLAAPLSGQRAVRGDKLPMLLPFAARFGMEVAMNIDAARAGLRIRELELELKHRVMGKTPRGFLHRGRQLIDVAVVYLKRR